MTDHDLETPWAREGRWIAALSGALSDSSIATGDHAALRRMDPQAPSGRALIAAERLFVRSDLRPEGDDLKRWLLILHCLGLAGGRHAWDADAGRVLAELRYSEERLTRLLSSDFAVVAEMMPRLARLLGAKSTPIDWLPLAQILRWTGRNEDRADHARNRIARSYARAVAT